MNNITRDFPDFSRKVLFVSGMLFILAIAFYLLWHLFHVILLIFSGILLAVLLDGLSTYLKKKSGIPHGFALLIVVVLITAFFFIVFWITGPRIIEQFSLLGQRIPAAFDSFRSYLEKYSWGKKLISEISTPGKILPMGTSILGGLTGAFTTVLDLVTGILIILFVGIYAAASPGLYVSNIIRIFPQDKRERAREIFKSEGQALHWWLIGRFISMGLVGILTIIGLTIAGIPLVLVLGFIAALFSFVPYIGAWLSAVPAGLVALAESPQKLFYVALVYLGVHLFEGYLITPLIQKRAVSLPPALLLTMQIIMGVLAGAIGILLATPLAVAVIVLIQMIYIQDILGEKCKVLGTHKAQPPR